MSLLSRLFGKKEAPEVEMGKYPDLEQGPGLGQPSGIGTLSGGPGLTEAPEGAMAGFEDIGQAPPAPITGMGMPAGRGQLAAPSAFAPAPVMQGPSAASGADLSRDMQIVNAKLDTLKALLDSVNAKLDRIERQAPKEEEPVQLSVRQRWR
jgi:hypothetical protein